MDEETEGVEEAAAVPPPSPLAIIQEAIAVTLGDDSLLAGFVVVAEWIEPDGGFSMSTLSSPMPPWHMEGLLQYALTNSAVPLLPVLVDLADDDEDWDDED